MTPFSLLVMIVPKNRGDFIVKAANKGGARGGTILMGRGTASNSVLQIMGLGDVSKDIVFVLVPYMAKKAVIDAVKIAAETKKRHFGILFSIDTLSFLRAGYIEMGAFMDKETPCQMITVIVNKGYADDVMASARKAGARGGTILDARGSAKEGDAKFFGVQIVPEKEMLIIVAETKKASSIMSAIKSLRCLSDPGSGIAFCTGADDFTMLGKRQLQ